MAIQWCSNIRNLFAFRSLLHGFALGASPYDRSNSVAITIYPGVKPSAAIFTSNWVSYNSTKLAHYTDCEWYISNFGNSLQLTLPLSSTPSNSGVGSWCCLWSINTTGNETTMPSDNFILCDVTDKNGKGIIRFEDLLFMELDKDIYDGVIDVEQLI